jgi:hypothetical protein
MKPLIFLILVVGIAAATSIVAEPANAQTGPTLLELSHEGTVELAPRIAYRDGIKYIAYIRGVQGANGDIMFAVQLNSDSATPSSFKTPVAITNTGKVNATLQRGPEFVFSPNGHIHLVWMEQKISNSPDIFYSRSTDDGMTWSAPKDISRDEQRAAQDFPSIAADSAGNLYVDWIDNRDLIDGNSQNDHLYLTRSLDNGNTWETPKRIDNNPGSDGQPSGGSCECCRTAIAASPDGDVYVGYRTNMDNPDDRSSRDIFVERSADRALNFGQAIRVQTKPWMIMACPATGPMIALDKRQNLHIVYRSAAYDDKSILFYNLLPKGSDRTFNEIPLTNLAGSGANFPDIALAMSGALSVVYQQSGSVFNRLSLDGGNTWTMAMKLDAASTTQSFPRIAYDLWTSDFSAVWQDTRRDDGDVMLLTSGQSPSVKMPVLTFFERTIIGDSAGSPMIRLTWGVAGESPATWFEIKTIDTTIVTFDKELTLPRALLQNSVVILNAVTAIGSSQEKRLAPLAVERNEAEAALSFSHHPILAGETVTIQLNDARNVVWKIYDVQGREQSVITSTPVGSRHEIQIPELLPGVYYMHSDALSVKLKLVVAAR